MPEFRKILIHYMGPYEGGPDEMYEDHDVRERLKGIWQNITKRTHAGRRGTMNINS